MSFCPKTPKLGFLWFWKSITFCEKLRLKWGLKQSCTPHQELFNDMLHATYKQVNQGDSWLWMVGSQITNLTPDPSFDHNLCYKYSNETCKNILDLYVPRAFQWYKELFNMMNFDLCNSFLNYFWGPTWECVGAFPHTFIHSHEHEMWFTGFTLGPHLSKPLFWSWAQGQGHNITYLPTNPHINYLLQPT
jgi:hypothetical protein